MDQEQEYMEADIEDNKLFNYSPVPALFVTVTGIVSRINVAFRELFSDESAGCCGQHYSKLEDRLRKLGADHMLSVDSFLRRSNGEKKVEKGYHCQTSELAATIHVIAVDSNRFERLALRVGELIIVDTESGLCVGSLVTFEIIHAANPLAVRQSINNSLSHELLWEVYASSYDHVLPELNFYRDALDRHCTVLADDRIRRIVDIGAGTGLQSRRLLSMGKHVTAVETSQPMLRRLRSKISKEFRAHCEVLNDSAEYLPQLANESFDGASILLAFFDMSNPWRALHEVQRLVASGGVIVLTEPRATFDVAHLMSAAQEHLLASGKMEHLQSEWRRIQTVAPLIRKQISKSQVCHQSESVDVSWSAENVHEYLKCEGYSDLRMSDSHLGNCATISGIKP